MKKIYYINCNIGLDPQWYEPLRGEYVIGIQYGTYIFVDPNDLSNKQKHFVRKSGYSVEDLWIHDTHVTDTNIEWDYEQNLFDLQDLTSQLKLELCL